MLRSTVLTILAFALAAPATAAEPTLVGSGSFEGDKFEYTTRLAQGDKIHIDGKFLNGKQQFSYVVKPSGRVDGFAGNTPVSFFVSREQRNLIADQLKAAQAPSLAQAGTASSAAR